ncbi:uncharacterized protein G2W53_014085 [Senna tora]|uniref:Transposase (putative) gypsy type domain-containing protein n=1 Tax=Senna tora TaxID=362788 RepID=A0A834U0D9_9FABA|nr:uncharacterized protein G2W53_014085 [Senna tora]
MVRAWFVSLRRSASSSAVFCVALPFRVSFNIFRVTPPLCVWFTVLRCSYRELRPCRVRRSTFSALIRAPRFLVDPTLTFCYSSQSYPHFSSPLSGSRPPFVSLIGLPSSAVVCACRRSLLQSVVLERCTILPPFVSYYADLSESRLVRGVGSSLDTSLAVSSAPEDFSATAASSSSDEDLDVVEPWLVRRHIPESYYGDLSWLDSSVSTHKSTLCRVGRIRSLWGSYFAPYESFLRATSEDARLSLEHGFIMPPFSDFEVGVLDYLRCPPSMLYPNCWLHMGGFQAICARLEVTSTVESFFYLYVAVGVRGGKHFHFQGESVRLGGSPQTRHLGFLVAGLYPMRLVLDLSLMRCRAHQSRRLTRLRGSLIAMMTCFRFIPGRTPRVRSTGEQSSSQLHPPVRPTSARSSTSRCGSRDASDPNFRADGKHSTDPPRSSAQKSTKKGKAAQTSGEAVKERRSFFDRPSFSEFVGGFLPPLSFDEGRLCSHAGVHSRGCVPSYPEVGPIPRAAIEDSLFNNRYDAATTVRGEFSCSPDREAMENFVYSYGLRAFRDVITRDLLRVLCCQSFFCEFSNSCDEYGNARDSRNIKAVERAKEVMISSREMRADLDVATAKVAFLEAELSESRRVAEIAVLGRHLKGP